MSNFSEALAKREDSTASFQTLHGHVSDCLAFLCYIVKRETRAIDTLCTRFSTDRAALLRSLFLSTVLHDVGKLTEEFQTNIRQGKRSTTTPHPFFSVPILNWMFSKHLKHAFLEPGLYVELCSILGHHTQLNTNMYQAVSKEVRYERTHIAGFLNRIGEYHATVAFRDEFSLPSIKARPADIPQTIDPEMNTTLTRQIKDFIRVLALRVSEYSEKERAKSMYAFNQSVLKACDQMASRHFDRFARTRAGSQVFGPVLEDPARFFIDLRIRTSRIMPRERPLYRYQRELHQRHPTFALVRAPCGRGKTNAAVLWAKASCEEHGCNRMIVAMPTQITSNAMRTTLEDLSSENQVGIFHGRSFYLLKEERKKQAQRGCDELDDLDAENLEEVESENYMGRVYHKPITVSTTDHLVYSLVHGYSQADYALGNIQRAVLIFDEAHYYERQSLECLATVLKILRRMNIPHLVMSGTLPEFFADKVNEENCYKIIDDTEGSNLTPFAFRRRLDERLIIETLVSEHVLEEIVANYRDGLRQFVILNTVTRAKRFYDAIKERLGPLANVVLHHSQFAFIHRSDKERLIVEQKETRPFVLVATQVIEISLNISCDVMYTEVAPADALGQRGGRLHRGGSEPRSNSTQHTMHVFGVEKHLPYDEDLLHKTKKSLFDGPASYLQITEICNEVYRSFRLHEHAGYRSLFSDSTLFGRPYWDIASEDEEGRPGFRFREENEYRMIPVIPESLYKSSERNLVVENEVQIPLWRFLKHQDDPTMFYQASRDMGRRKIAFWICRTPYNGEVGFLEGNVPESETHGANIF